MVWTSGSWTVKPGYEKEFVDAWLEFATWSKAEFAGSQAWLLRDRDRQNVFVTVGPWPSDAAIATWRASAGFGERIGRIRSMLEAFEPRTLDEVASID